MRALQLMLGRDARVETASVEAVLAAFDDEAGGKPRSGYAVSYTHLDVYKRQHDSRLLPLSNGWKKYPSAENSRMANDTFDRHADTQ